MRRGRGTWREEAMHTAYLWARNNWSPRLLEDRSRHREKTQSPHCATAKMVGWYAFRWGANEHANQNPAQAPFATAVKSANSTPRQNKNNTTSHSSFYLCFSRSFSFAHLPSCVDLASVEPIALFCARFWPHRRGISDRICRRCRRPHPTTMGSHMSWTLELEQPVIIANNIIIMEVDLWPPGSKSVGRNHESERRRFDRNIQKRSSKTLSTCGSTLSIVRVWVSWIKES